MTRNKLENKLHRWQNEAQEEKTGHGCKLGKAWKEQREELIGSGHTGNRAGRMKLKRSRCAETQECEGEARPTQPGGQKQWSDMTPEGYCSLDVDLNQHLHFSPLLSQHRRIKRALKPDRQGGIWLGHPAPGPRLAALGLGLTYIELHSENTM